MLADLATRKKMQKQRAKILRPGEQALGPPRGTGGGVCGQCEASHAHNRRWMTIGPFNGAKRAARHYRFDAPICAAPHHWSQIGQVRSKTDRRGPQRAFAVQTDQRTKWGVVRRTGTSENESQEIRSLHPPARIALSLNN